MIRDPYLEAKLVKHIIDNENDNIDSVDIASAFKAEYNVEQVMHSLHHLQIAGKIFRQSVGLYYRYVTPNKYFETENK